MGQWSRFLAEEAGFDPHYQLMAHFSGLLHDIGKIEISVDVLNKSRLDEGEYEKMQDHATASAKLLDPLIKDPFFREVQLNVLHHHERIDGNGYPLGVPGLKIPLISKVILIVDTVDAMTSDRPYRKGLPIEVAYRELERCSGTQFDLSLIHI